MNRFRDWWACRCRERSTYVGIWQVMAALAVLALVSDVYGFDFRALLDAATALGGSAAAFIGAAAALTRGLHNIGRSEDQQ